ncbi:hypothetical protein ACK8HX_12455 [Oryzobacter sp. R7]|uniref:hypothetical protein n=1 Tax=Oryzobacter faecalis TaxID=3388656 RepID=UPI00398D367E
MEQDPALAAVRTYGYLRLALAGLVLLLFSAVAIEYGATGFDCLQTSVSAYWHTPVRAVFVGVLVTMGICLVALKGNTPGEDVALNFAGMLAPGVAFIPTGDPGSCSSVPITPADAAPAVANNMQALFVLGGAAIVLAFSLARRAPSPRGTRLGLAVAVLVMAGGAVWFFVSRQTFLDHGHDAAAIPMFLAIVVAVWLNGRDVDRAVAQGSAAPAASRYVPVYRTIATLMLVTLGLTVALAFVSQWEHLVLWVEVVLILLFAVFWVVQTVELWGRGLRTT